MEKGHGFKEEHGFTGSAHEGREYRAEVPGYKRGGNFKHPPHVSNTVMPDTSNDDEMSAPSGPAMSPGAQGFRHGGRVEHDNHAKHDHMKYDKHGFASHKKHKE